MTENTPDIKELLKLVKSERKQVYTVQDYDTYTQIGAAYVTLERIAKLELDMNGEAKLDILEKKNNRNFARLITAAGKVSWDKEIKQVKESDANETEVF